MDAYDLEDLFPDETPTTGQNQHHITQPGHQPPVNHHQQQDADYARRLRTTTEASHQLLRSISQVANQEVQTIGVFSEASTAQSVVKTMLANRNDTAVMRTALKAFYLLTDSAQIKMFSVGRDVADIFVYALEVDPESATRSIFVSCFEVAANRQDFWEAGLVQKFKELLRSFSPEAIRYACETMSIYAREESKAKIMWEAGMADLVIHSLWDNKTQPNVAYSVCLLLSRFAFHQANTRSMRLNSAETVILETMRENKFDIDAQMAAFSALFWLWDGGCPRCLCPDGAGVCGCFQTRACRVFLDTLHAYRNNPAITKVCLDTFARLAPCIKDSLLAMPVCNGLVPCLRTVHSSGGADSIFIILETILPFLSDDAVRLAQEAVTAWLTQEQTAPPHVSVCARHLILMLQRDSGTTKLCELCRVKEVTHVLRDCAHAVLCEICVNIVFIRPYRVCPYPSCRKKITKQPLKFLPPKQRSGGGGGSEENEICVTCQDQPVSQVFEDCGHACCCKRCAEQISQTTRPCPTCTRRITNVTGFAYPWVGRNGGGGIVNSLHGGSASFMF